jgi:Flp pilus assembly protein TadB
MTAKNISFGFTGITVTTVDEHGRVVSQKTTGIVPAVLSILGGILLLALIFTFFGIILAGVVIFLACWAVVAAIGTLFPRRLWRSKKPRRSSSFDEYEALLKQRKWF